jgi:hypothetical protein
MVSLSVGLCENSVKHLSARKKFSGAPKNVLRLSRRAGFKTYNSSINDVQSPNNRGQSPKTKGAKNENRIRALATIF